MYDVSEILTPNSLLCGLLEFENKCVDEGYFEISERNELWLRKFVVEKVVESFCLLWHREYLDGLREITSCKKVGKRASEIRVGDVVVTEEDIVPRQGWE